MGNPCSINENSVLKCILIGVSVMLLSCFQRLSLFLGGDKVDNISPNETDPYDIFLLTVINCVEQT